MKISNRHFAIIALIIANIVWGTAAPMFKWALVDIPPFTLAFFRFFIASLLLWPFAIPHVALKTADIPKIILLSFTGLIINISFFFMGLQLTTSINATVIASSAPILLMLIAITYLKERPKKRVIIGTGISLIGILFIILRPLLENGSGGSILGNLCIVISTIGIVLYTILLKKFNLPYNPLALVFWLFFAAALLFFPLFIWETQTTNILHHITTRSIVGILFGALSSSTLAYLCYDLGVQYLKANEVGIFFYLDPIATVLLAMPLLGERITLMYIIGALTVFVGIYVAEGRLYHRHSLHPHS